MVRIRARSADAKRARRQFILAAAEQLLRRDGFDAFTMNKLAAATNLAKGTLYLYFATREELVLALYTDLNDGWMNRIITSEKHIVKKNYADFCTLFFETFVADGLLVDLAARVTFGLEPYVPLSGWITAKQAQTRFAKRLGGMFCQSFGSDPAQAQRLAWAFLAALSGAQQRAIDTADYAKLPPSLQKLGEILCPRNVFLNMVLPLAPNLSE